MERDPSLRLCTHRFLPNLKRLCAPQPIVHRLHEVATEAEEILGQPMQGQKLLSLF